MIRLRLFRKFGLPQKPPRWLVSLLVSYSSFVLLAPEILFASSSSPFTASKEPKQSRNPLLLHKSNGRDSLPLTMRKSHQPNFFFGVCLSFNLPLSLWPRLTICKILQRIYISLSVPEFFLLFNSSSSHTPAPHHRWVMMKSLTYGWLDFPILSHPPRMWKREREKRAERPTRKRRKNWETGLNNGLDVTSQNLKGFPA